MTEIIAIIGARSGSKGIKMKNICSLMGKPLIYYTIKAAKESKYISRIIVSTDSEEIAAVARECGAETPFIRPYELATDTATAESFLRHAVRWLERYENYHPDIIVYLQITDLFRKKGIIDLCIKELIEDDSLDSVFVARQTHKKFWKLENGRYVRLTERAYIPRQIIKNSQYIFREDSGIACATRASLVKHGIRIGDNVKIIINDGIDIDVHSSLDLYLTEQCMKLEKEKGSASEYAYLFE
jgi:CMP-N,N'-diacetyllegionaminic acid synthase